MRFFNIDEGIEDNTWVVGLEDDAYALITPYYINGSYNIVAARMLGLSYPDYLRYIRQNYNATLRGRQGYSYAFFKNRNDCYDLVDLLNKKWKEVEEEITKLLKGNEK